MKPVRHNRMQRTRRSRPRRSGRSITRRSRRSRTRRSGRSITRRSRRTTTRRSRRTRPKKIYHGGELTTKNINQLRGESTANITDGTYNGNESLEKKIHKDKRIGCGYQGKVYEFGTEEDNMVAKMMRLPEPNKVPLPMMELIECSFYASQLGIGPTTFHEPFLTKDGKHVVFVMEKVDAAPDETNREELIAQLITPLKI